MAWSGRLPTGEVLPPDVRDRIVAFADNSLPRWIRQLAPDVQERIFAFADNCLSQLHVGLPTDRTFLLLRHDIPGWCSAVLEEQWRAEAHHYYRNQPDGVPCETCGIYYLHGTLIDFEVAVVRLAVHRPITYVPRDNMLPLAPHMRMEQRAICMVCRNYLYCRFGRAPADNLWPNW